jgi:mannose/fructose/N-acetylgalactosamine-specific phosphotransferase system component IID
MGIAMGKIKNSDFINMFFRSFFNQTTWNYKGLLSIGFCMAVIPVARRLYNDKNSYQQFLSRHLNFFNSHPYTASYAIGAIARIEEELAESGNGNYEQIDKFKNALIGPLGAVGDQLFWVTVKPAVALLGMGGLLLLENLETKLLFLILLLILYNVPHLYIRWNGLIEGYRQGYNVYKLLKIEHFSKLRKSYLLLGAFSLGIFGGTYLVENFGKEWIGIIVFLGSMLIAYYMRTHKMMIYNAIFIPLIFAIIIGLLVTIL